MFDNFQGEGCNYSFIEYEFSGRPESWDKMNSSPVKTGFLPFPFLFKQRRKYFYLKTSGHARFDNAE
jgi:hypothetical protein